MRIKKLITGVVIATMIFAAGCGNKTEKEVQDDNESVTKEEAGMQDEAEDSENNIGKFATTDIYGEAVTQDIFAGYDLTLVNLFATWCGPCVQEMPELAQLQKDMKDKGVNIVAVVLDAAVDGVVDDKAVETAKEIADMAGVEFTFMIPDETNLNGRIDSVTAVPESFFVDKNGNMVGEPYVGARSYDEWKAIIEDELEK